MSKYKDFDAAIAELEPITWTIGGREYSIPSDVAAGPVMEVLANGAETLKDPAIAVQVLEGLVGSENYRQMLADNVGLSQLMMLFEWILQQLGFSPDPEAVVDPDALAGDDEGKASRSETSSSNGQRSKRTSSTTTTSRRSKSAGAGS